MFAVARTAGRLGMKRGLKTVLAVATLTLMSVGLGVTYGAKTQTVASAGTHASVVQAHHMIADGDIGDGTSPTKKG
jgi:hypothetical protein